MDNTGFLTTLMTVIAPLLLAAVLAYALITTRRRRQDPAAQNRTARGTEAVYEAEERKVRREEKLAELGEPPRRS